MKALLICEAREGQLLESSYELLGFAAAMEAEPVMALVGSEDGVPDFNGKVYLGDVAEVGEYNPEAHKQVVLEAIEKESPDYVVFSHSSYGWDLAPRVASALGAAQISEVVEVVDGRFALDACNAKVRRLVAAQTDRVVLTVQAGAFSYDGSSGGSPQVEKVSPAGDGQPIEFLGYEEVDTGGVDLTKAEVIVSAGRGIGKEENVQMIRNLAKAMGGELGASRPVVDAGWVDHGLQVGTTGQTVSPKLYMACGISGAIQHLAGMKKSDFIVAVNTDADAPIKEVADVLVVADVNELAPALLEELGG